MNQWVNGIQLINKEMWLKNWWEWNQMKPNFFGFVWWNVFGLAQRQQWNSSFFFHLFFAERGAEEKRERKREEPRAAEERSQIIKEIFDLFDYGRSAHPILQLLRNCGLAKPNPTQPIHLINFFVKEMMDDWWVCLACAPRSFNNHQTPGPQP